MSNCTSSTSADSVFSLTQQSWGCTQPNLHEQHGTVHRQGLLREGQGQWTKYLDDRWKTVHCRVPTLCRSAAGVSGLHHSWALTLKQAVPTYSPVPQQLFSTGGPHDAVAIEGVAAVSRQEACPVYRRSQAESPSPQAHAGDCWLHRDHSQQRQDRFATPRIAPRSSCDFGLSYAKDERGVGSPRD
jgi:hypothetical protein